MRVLVFAVASCLLLAAGSMAADYQRHEYTTAYQPKHQEYTTKHMEYTTAYEAPKKAYTTAYVAPKQEYTTAYEAPKQEYTTAYEAPKKAYTTAYVAPKQEYTTAYEAPKQEYTTAYEAPKQEYTTAYVAPKQEYTTAYEAPKKAYTTAYEAPKQEYTTAYEAPKHQEYTTAYEAPKQEYTTAYEAPKQEYTTAYVAPKQEYTTKHMEYTTAYEAPKQEYTTAYEAPKQEYTTKHMEYTTAYEAPKKAYTTAYEAPKHQEYTTAYEAPKHQEYTTAYEAPKHQDSMMVNENTYLLPPPAASRGDDEPQWPLYKKCIAEFFATLLFVFIGCGAIQTVDYEEGQKIQLNPQTVLTIALAHGLAIFALVAATAKISGGHINPAVSLGIFLADHKTFTAKHLAAYVVSQISGAIAGAAILLGVYPLHYLRNTNFGAHQLSPAFTVGNGVLLEAILTMLLVLVVLRTAVDRVGQSFAPLAIGIVVTIDHLVGVPVTGASMNPARSFGPALLGNAWTNHWIYWVGPSVGAVVAAFLYFVLLRTRV
ncbi:aquaporin [Salpingoeca rosetta]|uniref:Aquaporin n=1 Tax=Salpingoeca rosetta (strain ATCC 50818 / BSB-021) TaxID=946362 RepID=F2UB52_SALR5|nr:aquaporin [Salpingoeca rosetta]EGD74065.1 aquaporin [Salpingoeca rosetta]|eukprot:XP_004993627.1 aquaporin [Salpingoeca rosetta]